MKIQPYHSKQGTVTWQSPSNIAIVKYWGKTGIQIPVNPSISFTLRNAVTKTTISYQLCPSQEEISYNFSFNNEPAPSFENKLNSFFERIIHWFPWLNHFHLEINSSNTFPHSSGIASSASSYSSIALVINTINHIITNNKLSLNTVSEIARLGSGSACRSVFGGWNLWGESQVLPCSSNHFACQISNNIHPDFQSIQDTILIVSKDKKPVSSSMGHQLMENHPYKQGRIIQAHENCSKILQALQTGNWKLFIEITESEALSLHGLMMSSNPGFVLLHPNSLKIINLIRNYRNKTSIPICFTIDAGPNIHVLYPEANKKEVLEFIHSELKPLCEDGFIINDEIGPGPVEIK